MTYYDDLRERALTPEALQEGECWVWEHATDPSGYGKVKVGGRSQNTHRVAASLAIGDVDGLDVDHVCRNRRCYRPSHLRIVTRRENIMADGSLCVAKANTIKTQCPHGHTYTSDNTLIDRNGYRECRACDRERHRAYNREWMSRYRKRGRESLDTE